nr:hypothetical protein [bacterium]
GDFTDEQSAVSPGSDAFAGSFAGGGPMDEAGDEFAEGAQADMNVAMMNVLSEKVEAAVNEELARMEVEEGEAGSGKDIRVGLGERGLTLFIEDEALPFASGTMALDGQVGLRLRFNGFSGVSVIASGTLTSSLQGVERTGEVRGIPYELTLEGGSEMKVDGAFTMRIRNWRVDEMGADFSSRIVRSDVVATGTIAGQSAQGSVDMVNVAVRLENDDILRQPKAFAVSCTGTMATRINGNVFASCNIDESCLGCN